MATDDLIPDADDKGKEPAKSAPQFSKSDISDAVKEGLSGLKGELGQFAKDVGAHVNQALSAAQTKVDKGTASKAEIDLTQRLLTDPESAISEVVQKIITAQLGPYLQTQVNDSYEGLVETQQKRVDARFGEGAFEQFIRPELDAVVAATKNPAAKASKEYIKTVVNGIIGNDDILTKLEGHKAKDTEDKKAAAEKDDAPVGILDGGRRKPGKLTLSDQDRAFLSHLEDRAGVKTDAKLLESALAVRSRDGEWTVDNFPGLKQN